MSGGTPSRPLPTPKAPTRKSSDAYESSPEKENQSPTSHRSLTAPKDLRPADAAVPVSSFYAGSSKARAGSSHTTYVPPNSPPPTQRGKDTSYREPELVNDLDAIPPLEPINEWGVTTTSSGWDSLGPSGDWRSWDNRWSTNRVDIDGRDEDEELKWSDPDVLAKAQRPGPGMLPPLVAQTLHNPDHTLYSVSASAPPPKPAPAASTSPPPPASAPSPPPTADEIRTAVPHPHAYYCREHNGWVLLSWCSSSVLPPISPTFKSDRPFPDQARRKRKSTCVTEGGATTAANVTHHFHKYAKAVDARMLTTPFKRSEWEAEALRKQRRRKMTFHADDEQGATVAAGEKAEAPDPDLLDLYICCQCSVYCLVSQVIPGVLPLRLIEEFVKDKLEHPPVGKTGEIAVVTGIETIITYVLALLRLVCIIKQEIECNYIFRVHTVSSRIDYGREKAGCYLSRDPSFRANWGGMLQCKSRSFV